MIRVYDFNVRISKEAQRVAIEEIERGRQYYNAMIAELNNRVQAEIPVIESLSHGDRFLARLALLWPWWSPTDKQQELADSDRAEDQKSKLAMAIYACIAHHARDVRHDMPTGPSGCYTGTYHAVHAAFDAAIADKRKGTWPGDPYYFRRQRDKRGATCGVHLQGGSYTWGKITSGATSLIRVGETTDRSTSDKPNHAWELRPIWLKVSKESEPIEIIVKLHRRIPDDAVITHAILARSGDYGTGLRWRLLITAKLPPTDPTSKDAEPIGVSLGCKVNGDGSILVAAASNGESMTIPAYAVRMRQKLPIVTAARENLALIERDKLEGDKSKLPSNPARVADYIERNGLRGHSEFVTQEHYQHCLYDHLIRRSERIRKEAVRQFTSKLRGKVVYIEKQDRKTPLASGSNNDLLKFAGVGMVVASLKQAGAIEVPPSERLGDATAPTREKAEKILTSGIGGKAEKPAARKTIRKYRKSRQGRVAPINACSEAL